MFSRIKSSGIGRLAVVGVIHSGQCFCPSRTPQRNGNIKGRGTPLPSCADFFLHGLPGTALASVMLAVASRITDRAPAA
jgi:hypothetical protein